MRGRTLLDTAIAAKVLVEFLAPWLILYHAHDIWFRYRWRDWPFSFTWKE